MEKAENESRSYPMNGIRLCIDREGERIAGRMYSKMSETPIPFESSSNMLLAADDFFNKQGYPQCFLEPRSFLNNKETYSSFRYPKAVMSDTEIMEQEGKCDTLDVFVQSRRKAGWQGIVFKPVGQFVGEFNSELELLMILEKEMKKQEPEKKG